MPNSSIWPIDRTLSDTTSLGQSGLGSNRNGEVLHIPQSTKTNASQLDCLTSLVGGEFYPYDETQLVYSSVPANWIILICYISLPKLSLS